ncbi:MAG TPA: S53 family serine peptidase [Steroidobacteraceae bacterium]|nr:S53 family serine peptidase [Steroidobacteraceae bacterium]
MRIRSFVTGAVLSALAMTSASLPDSASATALVQSLGAASQDTTTQFSVYLPLTHTAALEQLLKDQTDESSPNYHHWLTPAQFKSQFGPNPPDVAKAKSLLASAGFTVTGEQTQSLQVRGPVWAVEKAFATQLEQVKTPKGRIRLAATKHPLTLPQALASMGAVIPQFTPHLFAHVHSHAGRKLSTVDPLARLSSNNSFFYPNDLNEAYQLPSFRTEVTPLHSRKPAQIAGVGSTIGIVMSSVIDPADLAKTFNSSFTAGGVPIVQAYSANSNLPVPTVTVRAVDGGSGPFDPNSDAGFEAALDTQMSLGTAPGAKEILYDIPDLSNDAVLDGYTAVVEDNKADVVSSSFGECELDFTAANNGGTDFTGILKTQHAIFQQGNSQGITFLASSGDNGAPACLSTAFQNSPSDGTNFVLGVENPADDPSVTAVGGTNLQTTATPGVDDATYQSENADFDPRLPAEFDISPTQSVFVGNNTWGSGGGFSQIFSKPLYQFLVNTGSATHRAVPDVSLMMGGCPGDADLAALDCTVAARSAVILWFAGTPVLVIGTSSSSPEMAGVLALAVELNGGRLGNVNPLIYSLSAVQTLAGGTRAPKALQYFHRNISGNNNGYSVKPGQAFSEVLGNSTLEVKNFLQLQLAAPAGAPNTPSNP